MIRHAILCSAIAWYATAFATLGWAGDEPARRTPEWVENRIAAWQPTREERAFEDIDWAPNLSQAESVAKKHARAIFLFTYDGADFAGYRC